MTMIQNIRRFTASQAGGQPVTREEFDALKATVDSLMDEVDAILSPDNLGAAIGNALKPITDELAAARGTGVSNRARILGQFRIPEDDDEPAQPSSQPIGNRTAGKRVAGFLAPEGD